MTNVDKRPRAAEKDPLAVNSTTLHQYYNTVQSDTASEHAVDAALSRRQAMALQARRRRGRPVWLTVVALGALLASGVWLFG